MDIRVSRGKAMGKRLFLTLAYILLAGIYVTAAADGYENEMFPDSLTIIETEAFFGCSDLTTVEIPDSVTAIGDRAFYGCTNLEFVNIPNSVTEIGIDAFLGCASPLTVQVERNSYAELYFVHYSMYYNFRLVYSDAHEVMSHADFIAAPLETEVTVETYVQAKQSWWDNRGSIYTQAEDGAYFIYNMPMSQEEYDLLVPGTKIRVSGYKAEWAGEVEIVDASYEILEAEPFFPDALDITALLGTEELIVHQNELVCIKGAVVTARKDANGNDVAFLYNWDGSGTAGNNSDLYFDVTVNGDVYTFTVESYLCGEDTEVYQSVTKLNIGDVIDIEGFLYWYNGAQPHVISIQNAN